MRCVAFVRSLRAAVKIRVIAYYLKVVDLYLVAEIGVCEIPALSSCPRKAGIQSLPLARPGSIILRTLPWAPACERVKEVKTRWIDAVRPSRRPLCLEEPPQAASRRGRPPQERTFLNAIRDIPHAEERSESASRSTHDRDAALRTNSFTASCAGVTIHSQFYAMWDSSRGFLARSTF